MEQMRNVKHDKRALQEHPTVLTNLIKRALMAGSDGDAWPFRRFLMEKMLYIPGYVKELYGHVNIGRLIQDCIEA